jgi:class 3 adenylate cyclase
MRVLLQDGTEFEVGPMSLMDIPAGHDAWVVGDEAVETIAWTGAKGWLAPLESLTDRVLATLVLTDVVDSTGTARRLGDRAFADLMTTHESRTRDALARFRGREVKMTGDGVLAMFDGAARALRCAVALRDGAEDLGLEIRAAVHTGEVELAGTDIRGVAIHETSRMLGIAGGGEILVSAPTAALTADLGLAMEDRGPHQLRGIEGSRRIYALR